MKGTRQPTKQPAARKQRVQSDARRTVGKYEKGVVLDERGQEQPADRKTAQRSGRPSRRVPTQR